VPGGAGNVAVVADDTDQCRARTERGDVDRDVAGTARHFDVLIDFDDGEGRFATEPADAAGKIYIEQGIADDYDMTSLEFGGETGEIDIHDRIQRAAIRAALSVEKPSMRLFDIRGEA